MLSIKIKSVVKLFIMLVLVVTFINTKTNAQGKNTISPCPIDADIWVLAGQSQMAGAGRTPDTLTDSRIIMLNMDNKWITAKNPLHRIFEAAAPAYESNFIELLPDSSKANAHEQFKLLSEMSKKSPVGGVGPGLYFAQKILNETGRPVALIPCALGGSKMDMWYPSKLSMGDESLYGAMIDRVKAAGVNKVKGMLWSQGESEAMLQNTSNYEADLINLIESFRRDINRPDLPVILVQSGRFLRVDLKEGRSWESLRDIQRRVCKKVKNVYMTSGIDLPLDDCAHISTDGQRVLGKRLAEIALTYVYNLPGHAQQIELESITLKKDDASGSNYLLLHYSGVCGKLQAKGRPSDFEIRVDGEPKIEYVASKVEFDPVDEAGLRVFLSMLPPEGATLVCGAGTNPYMNITDSLNNPVPAFGPVGIPVK